MPYVVKCKCGASSGCLPYGHSPAMQESVSQSQVEASKVCCQCGERLDSTKARYVHGIRRLKTREERKFDLLRLT